MLAHLGQQRPLGELRQPPGRGREVGALALNEGDRVVDGVREGRHVDPRREGRRLRDRARHDRVGGSGGDEAERCLDVLKEIMPSERDLIRVIVEIVVELRESEEEEEVADELPVRYISQVLDFADFVILCDSSTMTNRMFRKPPSAARNQRGR